MNNAFSRAILAQCLYWGWVTCLADICHPHKFHPQQLVVTRSIKQCLNRVFMSFLRRNVHSKEDKRIKKRVVNFSQKAISSWKRSAVKDYESPSQKSYGNFPRHKRYNEGGGTRLNSRLDSSTLGFSWHQDSSNHAKFPSAFSRFPPI